ncbi:MAG TPA: GTPase ObgE [Firmicutes bacterium]|nr:GTPase ObgE [Bacillota bacterium]
MFVDKAKIFIKSGDGGNGCTSFYTEKYVNNGGPDGGNGGTGGRVGFRAVKNKSTLADFKYAKHFRAENGENGRSRYSAGKCGKDLIIDVPVGTVIRDEESGSIIADMFEDGMIVIADEGGRGGKGNAFFKSSRRQAPHFSQAGEKTQEHAVTLELKTIADVGLIGYPNVGKSTILSVISAARPKIASYHFTTLSPNLGMVTAYDESFVVADIPGLIDGASEGAGLGHDFLRHIERTRLLVHVIDASGSEGRDPVEDYLAINRELAGYDASLAEKPQIVVLNKADMMTDFSVEDKIRALGADEVLTMSAVQHSGVDELIKAMYRELKKLPEIKPLEYEPFTFARPDKESFEIVRADDGSFELFGGMIDELARNVVLDNYDSMKYFQRRIKESGIDKALKKAGAKDGDTVRIMDIEFEYFE